MIFPEYKEYTYENYSFDLNDDKWKEYIKENGFVVIKNVINKDICKSFKNNLWETVKCLAKNNLDEGQNIKYAKNYPFALHGGMYNVGHTKTQWATRYRCKKVFDKLWNEKDLVTSFDKFCYCPKERTFQMKKISSWLHSDQSPLNEIDSYQGLLCLTDNSSFKSGGFLCIPKTNNMHKEICKENGDEKNKSDWIKLTDEFKEKLLKDKNVLKVRNNIGDFVLWDSKTIHSGMVPINKNDERYDRVCVYICMRPRKELSKRNIKRRLKAFEGRRSTTHNPVNFCLFEKTLGRFSGTTYEGIMDKLSNNKLLVEDDMNKNLI